MKYQHLNISMFLVKFYVEYVFRILMLSILSMSQTIFILGNLEFIFLRILFGTTSSSNFWRVMSELMADLIDKSMNEHEMLLLAFK